MCYISAKSHIAVPCASCLILSPNTNSVHFKCITKLLFQLKRCSTTMTQIKLTKRMSHRRCHTLSSARTILKPLLSIAAVSQTITVCLIFTKTHTDTLEGDSHSANLVWINSKSFVLCFFPNASAILGAWAQKQTTRKRRTLRHMSQLQSLTSKCQLVWEQTWALCDLNIVSWGSCCTWCHSLSQRIQIGFCLLFVDNRYNRINRLMTQLKYIWLLKMDIYVLKQRINML